MNETTLTPAEWMVKALREENARLKAGLDEIERLGQGQLARLALIRELAEARADRLRYSKVWR